ncbi:MAG: hypothetical protein RIR59_1381 [Pseudomonadota bacterium]
MKIVHGRVDAQGRLIAADPPLDQLHRDAGGVPGGALALPHLALIVRAAQSQAEAQAQADSQTRGASLSQRLILADGPVVRDLWIEVSADATGVGFAISGWDRPGLSLDAELLADSAFDQARLDADCAWRTDAQLRITHMAAGVDRDIGFLPATARGLALAQVLRPLPDPAGDMPMLGALANRAAFEGQVAECSPTGQVVMMAATPHFDAEGQFAGLVGQFRAIASAPAAPAPEGLAEAERDTDLSAAFLDRLEPSLRAPIADVLTHADAAAAQADGPLRHVYVRYAEDIAGAARHLLGLVGDLARTHDIERPDFRMDAETLDLTESLHRAIGLFGVRLMAQQVEIIARGADQPVWARGDFGRVLQILVNLISNAVRYAPAGSAITAHLIATDDHVAVIIADQGPGIAPDDQDRIFHKFERLNPSEAGGTGLGLYISRRLARAMGGDVTVDSAVGQGARFCLRLCPAPPPSAAL